MKYLIFFHTLFFISLESYAQIISTIAGNGVAGFSGEGGPATAASFNIPSGATVDKKGNTYFADNLNNVVHRIDINGIVWRFAGTGAAGYSGDGGPATSAKLSLGLGAKSVVADSIGNVYFASNLGVRKVDTDNIITTVAGSGMAGYTGDGGPATNAKFLSTSGLCFDKMGNLYVSDEEAHVVRKVNTAGIISTVAGSTIGFSGDGGVATVAQLKTPEGIAVDDSGNLYIADFGNRRIRKVNSAGIISTIAGGDSYIYETCNGCAATLLQLAYPYGLAINKHDDLYVTVTKPTEFSYIFRITKAGLAYHFAGQGLGFSGDGGPAETAAMYAPGMLSLDTSDNLLFADRGNYRCRKITFPPVGISTTTKDSHFGISLYPNPHSGGSFSILVSAPANEELQLTIADMQGRRVYATTIHTNAATTVDAPLSNGIYTVTARRGENISCALMVCE